MSTLNNIQDMLDYVKQCQGIITLWRKDNNSPVWFTGNNNQPPMESNKFAFFVVPAPLIFVDDSNGGKFRYGGNVIFDDSQIDLDSVELEADRAGRNHGFKKGKTKNFWHGKDIGDRFTYLQNDANIWLPYCEAVFDQGAPNAYKRRLYFTPLQDGVLS